jgi:hypothetical protein
VSTLPTLAELQSLANQALSLERKADRARQTATKLSNMRCLDERPLYVWLTSGPGQYDDEVKSLLQGVINEHTQSLSLLVEARQEAFARQCLLEASAIRARLALVVAPDKASA